MKLHPLASTHSLAVTSHILKSQNSFALTAPWIRGLLTRCERSIAPTGRHFKCPEKPIPNKPSWSRLHRPRETRPLLLRRHFRSHFGSSRHVCSSSNELGEVTCREEVHLFTPPTRVFCFWNYRWCERKRVFFLTAIWLFLLW